MVRVTLSINCSEAEAVTLTLKVLTEVLRVVEQHKITEFDETDVLLAAKCSMEMGQSIEKKCGIFVDRLSSKGTQCTSADHLDKEMQPSQKW